METYPHLNETAFWYFWCISQSSQQVRTNQKRSRKPLKTQKLCFYASKNPSEKLNQSLFPSFQKIPNYSPQCDLYLNTFIGARTAAQVTTAPVDNCQGKTTAQVGQLPR